MFASSVIVRKNVFQKEDLNGEKKPKLVLRWGCFVPSKKELNDGFKVFVLPDEAYSHSSLR